MGKGSKRECMFCGSPPPHTQEHFFHKAWREKLDVTIYEDGSPNADRYFKSYNADNVEQMSRPETLFSMYVTGVCSSCNSGWMNALDQHVEPWVFDPTNDANLPDPKKFRRWALKVAILRAHYENPWVLPKSDAKALYAGDDIPDWHVFVGRSAQPDHRHALAGWGPLLGETGNGREWGITEIGWTLGRSFVVAIRIHLSKDESKYPAEHFKLFKGYNRHRNYQMLEVLPGASGMPSVRNVPGLLRDELVRLVWFFTPNEASPIADSVRGLEQGWRQAVKEMGLPLNEG